MERRSVRLQPAEYDRVPIVSARSQVASKAEGTCGLARRGIASISVAALDPISAARFFNRCAAILNNADEPEATCRSAQGDSCAHGGCLGAEYPAQRQRPDAGARDDDVAAFQWAPLRAGMVR